MEIRTNTLHNEQVVSLLEEHHKAMLQHSPAESVHALDLSGLSSPDVEFYSLWFDDEVAGIGALKRIDHGHGEIKSMRTATAHVRKGVAKKMLEHIIERAKAQGLKQLSLETGTQAPFTAAHKLYESFDFQICLPFAEYKADPYSRFMTKYLG